MAKDVNPKTKIAIDMFFISSPFSFLPTPTLKTLRPSTTLSMSVLEDVTFPSGCIVLAGSELLKTWKVKNTGVEDWPEGLTLKSTDDVFDDSTMSLNEMSRSQENLNHLEKNLDKIPLLKVDEEGEISTFFTVPDSNFQPAHFRLEATGRCEYFGELILSCVVKEDEDEGSPR